MIKKWKRKGKGTVRTQITEGNRNKNKTERQQNRRVIKKLAKSVHFMTRKHQATRNNYEELARFVAEHLEQCDLKYHLETIKKNATYLSVATFEKLQLAINNHIETGTAMELSLVNKFPLGADKSTSMSDTSEPSIFIKYDNPITNTLYQRFLCLVLLAQSTFNW